MEWFDKNATAIIAASAALLSALIAGGFAILNAWLTNKENNQRLQLQIDHEKVKESSKLFLDKGEELYVCVNSWITSCHAKIKTGKKIILKEITPEIRAKFLSSHIDYNNEARVETLLNIYFADLIEYKKECRKYLKHCEDIVDKFINGEYVEANDALISFEKFEKLFNNYSDGLIVSLQIKLKSQVHT